MQTTEWELCKEQVSYFVSSYCRIFNASIRRWIPFHLWKAQKETLDAFTQQDRVIVLKARQLGLTWLTLSYLLWQMLFYPAATVLIFSKRDEEATELLSNRLKGIHDRLPIWMREQVVSNNGHTWVLSNGSSARAFPTTGGRSYTASHVMIDEADFMPRFSSVMNAVQPTVDAGGQMIVISTVDKEQQESTFKRMYRAAEEGEVDYTPIFLPWHARPNRTRSWYEARKADSLAQNGTLDSLYQEYPATVEEALAPNTTNKRFPASWLVATYQSLPPLTIGPALPDLRVYAAPRKNVSYVIGADPAEGNPNSDDSAATVLEIDTGEEVARLRGKYEPSVFAAHLDTISKWYNNAPVMVERNNHGHAVLLALATTKRTRRLTGRDGKFGWLSSTIGKTTMYDALADSIRDNALSFTKIIHSQDTFAQLASIEGATLKAPEGLMDDLADSFALADVGRAAASARATGPQPSISQVAF